jgi:hypothetical protein
MLSTVANNWVFLYSIAFLVMLLPIPLILCARKTLGYRRWLWAAAASLPLLLSMAFGVFGLPISIPVESAWLIYLLFLFYCVKRFPSGRTKRKSYAIKLACAGLAAMLLVNAFFFSKQAAVHDPTVIRSPVDRKPAPWLSMPEFRL